MLCLQPGNNFICFEASPSFPATLFLFPPCFVLTLVLLLLVWSVAHCAMAAQQMLSVLPSWQVWAAAPQPVPAKATAQGTCSVMWV